MKSPTMLLTTMSLGLSCLGIASPTYLRRQLGGRLRSRAYTGSILEKKALDISLQNESYIAICLPSFAAVYFLQNLSEKGTDSLTFKVLREAEQISNSYLHDILRQQENRTSKLPCNADYICGI